MSHTHSFSSCFISLSPFYPHFYYVSVFQYVGMPHLLGFFTPSHRTVGLLLEKKWRFVKKKKLVRQLDLLWGGTVVSKSLFMLQTCQQEWKWHFFGILLHFCLSLDLDSYFLSSLLFMLILLLLLPSY